MSTVAKRLTWYLTSLIALAIVLAATFVSLGKMLGPYLNDHRHDFESWATQELHAPVLIDNVHITWYYYQPILTFEQVTVLNKDTLKPNLKIQQIKVNLKIFASLLHWQPILQYIKISGASLTVREQESGKMSVEGNSPIAVIDNITGSSVEPNALVAWILSQAHLVLADIQLNYVPLHESAKSVTLDRLSLTNNKTKHELTGNAILNQEIPTDVQVQLQLEGNVTDLSHIKAYGFFYVEGVSLTQWFKPAVWKNFQLMQGLGSAKVWIDWENNQLQKVNTSLQIYDLEIKSLLTQKMLVVSRLSGELGWKKEGDSQVVSGEDILIDFPEHLWPTTGFSVTLAPKTDGTLAVQSLRMDYLDIADVIELATATGYLESGTQKILDEMDPSGEINDLNIAFKTDSFAQFANNSISAAFTNLSVNEWDQYPGIENMTGSINWDGQQGNLKLNSQQAILHLTKLYDHPLEFNQINGDLHFQKDPQGVWNVTGKNIEAIDKDLTAKTNFTLTMPDNASPTIDLTGQFSLLDTTHINQYMPLKMMEPPLAHWLQNTFYGGQVTAGDFIIQGHLSDFPFDKNPGKFLVRANIQDLDFEFTPKWPGIKHLNGLLVFQGHTMTADVASGQMLSIPLKNIHGEIPYIGPEQPQILNINGAIDSNLPDAIQYIQHSPLQKKFGKNLNMLQMTGPLQLNLQLSIPLKTPEKTAVLGDLTFQNAQLTLPNWNLKIADVNGLLHFTDQDMQSTNIQATLLNQLINIKVNSIHPTKTGPATVAISFQGKISKADLHTWFQVPDTSFYQGNTTYSAQLNLTSDEQNQPTQFIITSDLKGIAINLPDIYGKKADEARPFAFMINMGKNNSNLELKVNYGNLLSTAVTLQKIQNKTQFYSGEVHVGPGSANWQDKPGLVISGTFDNWDLNTWKKYYAELPVNQKNSNNVNYNLLRAIDLNAKDFKGFGLELHAAHIMASQLKQSWQINLSSTEMTGQIQMPFNLKQTVQAHFDHLYIPPMSGASAIDPKTLPPLSFSGNDVRYQTMHLGSIAFTTTPTNFGLIIQSLHGSSEFYSLNARGEWRSTKNNSQSHLQGILNTKDVNGFLNQLGVKSTNLAESGADMPFNLSWSGAPYSPQLNTIVGDLSLKLTHGRIVDLSNSADAKMGIGKMLNLFNISSIPRRLSLNFNDLFQKGYSFDSMQGDFNLKNGSIFSEDARFDGPLASIAISGRVGYVAKDYDLKVSVTPYGMTSSLPLVATMVGGPVAGAATWVADKVIGGAVSNATTHHYTVRGTWSNPQWGE